MLLRRITKHVTDQNWFAVFVDFLIVVVGVFIGIQVANWNAELKIDEQRQLIKQRLVSDFVLLEDFSIETVDRHKKIIASLDTLIKAIERGEVLPAEDEVIKFALRWGGSYLKRMQRSPTYVELSSSGQLNLISSENLRSALAVFDELALVTEYNFSHIFDATIANYIYLPKYATLQAVDYDDPDVRLIATYDFKAILADEEYLSELKILLDLQSWFYSNVEGHNRLLKETKLILEGEK